MLNYPIFVLSSPGTLRHLEACAQAWFQSVIFYWYLEPLCNTLLTVNSYIFWNL